MDAKRSKRVLGQPANHGSMKSKANLDANSERNVAFYGQEGTVTVYPKLQVYPREGGEVQLEQLRAGLPRYCPPPPDEFAGDNMEMSMEMTMACTTNITILPGMLKNKENSTAQPRQSKGVGTRQPLQAVHVAPVPAGHTLSFPDEKLARLCEEMGGGVGRGRGWGRAGEEDSGEAISNLLGDMVLQMSAERQLEKQKNNAGVVGVAVGVAMVGQKVPAGNPHCELENLVDQENCQPPPLRPNTSSRGGCATRLNFSDAESSLGTSQLNSLTEDSVGGRASLLAHSQARGHEQSGAGGQSFDVFHDSWRSQSHNASYGRPDKLQPAARSRPLERKSEPHSLAESYQSYDQSHSFQAAVSKSNMSSFSAYEDTAAEQSSFAPFHDSWANSSKDTAGKAGGAATGALDQVTVRPISAQTGWTRDKEGEVVYHKALGVPLEGRGGGPGLGGRVNSSLGDQSFTQVDICHPKVTTSVSTPIGKNIDLTFDMSRIQSDTELLPQPHPPHDTAAAAGTAPQRKRSCLLGTMNLSTIKEESSSFKSSRSSASCTTGTSSSSSSGSVSHESLAGSPAEVNVNPFSSEIVNMMLNAMSPSVVEGVCRVLGCLPQLGSGRRVLLGQQEFTGLRKIASGGFGTIYSCKDQGEAKVLKVQKPALQWEMAIISELHTRLRASRLMCQCFVSAEQTFMFNDASVMVLPHYTHGSLLDLANAHRAHLYDSFLFYYTAEVLEIVASLHHCGILHTDIKPDNFMLTDISCHKNFASALGRGLVLIDFGRAVDLTVFPGDTLFLGSCETDSLQCTQMLEGRPWKYEADYFGIAATVHVLLTGEYMSVQKNPESNLYQPRKPLRRSQHGSLWSTFFSCLLNTTQPLPLAEMAAEMRTKLDGLKDYVFQAFYKKTASAVLKKLGQGT